MITGSIVALVTPMHDDGAIDWARLDALTEWHIEQGTNGIVPMGTTGESATVTPEEHCAVMKRVIDVVAGRIPVIAGTGSNATSEAIEFTEAAKAMGADACLLVTPYYNKPTQEGLFQHYRAIANAVDLPQVLYNVPGRTACDMLPATVARLSELPQVVAIKEATGDLNRTLEILELCGDRMVVYSGDDETAVDLMCHGAKGTISVTANVAPGDMAAVCAAAVAGHTAEAHRRNETLMGLHRNLFVEANPIPVKWALHQMGRIGPTLRLPLTPLSSQFHEQVRESMRQAGVI
ncbi:MAG: 4-hydroxy-tetrahydrodipicolinate synthase [Pseudomonadota bacterium]